MENNNTATPLSRWLNRTQLRVQGATVQDLEAIIRDGRKTPRSIADVLDGAGSNAKARNLWVRWNGPQPTPTKEVVIEKKVPESKFLIPNKQRIKTIRGEMYAVVHNEKEDKYDLHFATKTTVGSFTYTQFPRKVFEDHVKNFTWILVDPTPELEKIFGKYSNVVNREQFLITSHQDFKKGQHHIGLASYRGDLTKEGREGTSYQPHFHIGVGNTGNCQLSTIAYMCSLLTSSSDPKEQLRQIYKLSGRRLLLCDIRRNYVAKLKEVAGAANVQVMDYASTNGSSMSICLVNISKI